MVNYREILRLTSLNHTQHEIAASLHSSRNTIRDVLNRAKSSGLHWPLDDSVTNEEIKQVLYPEHSTIVNLRKEPDYKDIHSELAKSGVNLSLLWTEYCSFCRAEGSTPYMYTQFCEKYRSWARVSKATMRIKHKPVDVMQVDWAGTTIQYQDSVTGERFDTYLFAAVLPCSCYAYVEACDDMKSANWLLCHVHAYNYFGGVTRLLIPDNLKTVKFATTWVIAALRNRQFFSLDEIRDAVAEKLDALNHRPFKKREGCRCSAYSDEEKNDMKPLPLVPYEPAVWSTAKVPLDYLISDGKNKYSVPFDLIGEQVDIRLTQDTVEVFFHGARVASHTREMDLCPIY